MKAVITILFAALILVGAASATEVPCGECGAACENGYDDDNDSLIDFPADPGCTSYNDESEYNPAPPPPPPPPPPPLDWGSGYTEEQVVDDGYEPMRTCKTRTRGRKFTTWFGVTVWKYYERVRWCWTGNTINYINRTRWPEVGCCFWQFGGHVGNSCASENCAEQIGRNWADIITVGKMQHCMEWCLQERNPRIHYQIFAGGNYLVSTSG